MQFIKKILVVSATLLATHAYADGFSASVGADYSTGKYGSRDSTDVYYLPLVATYQTGAFTYKLTVPYIRVTGPGDVVPSGFGGSGSGSGATSTVVCTVTNSGKGNNNTVCNTVTTGATVTPTTTTTKRNRTTESGLGDIIASAAYNVLDTGGDSAVVLDVTGRIKFGTASESKGLGTGENDYALQVNLDKYFGSPYVSLGLGYKWLGEPRGIDYKNVVYGSLGGGYKVSSATDIGVSYDWATSSVSGGTKPQEISVYASHYINDQFKLSGVLYTGLSNASSDIGGGITLGYYF